MADLQARVVQPGDIGLVGLIGHGRERGSEVYVGDLGPFQQGAAGETGLTCLNMMLPPRLGCPLSLKPSQMGNPGLSLSLLLPNRYEAIRLGPLRPFHYIIRRCRIQFSMAGNVGITSFKGDPMRPSTPLYGYSQLGTPDVHRHLRVCGRQSPYRSSEGEDSEEDPLIVGSHAYEVTSRIRVHSLRPWHEAFSHRLEPLPSY